MKSEFQPLVCVVDFHHARGPEVEKWVGHGSSQDPVVENDWSLLPFFALADGAHAVVEEFSYFTLRRAQTKSHPATSLFGISCTRQLDARELIHRPADVTRSTVQKAVVAIVESPYLFPRIKEKISAVTKAWFAQRDFRDSTLLDHFQESLAYDVQNQGEDKEQYFGLSLREIIHEYKWQTLVLFKCCLLQRKMLFFGSQCERLCLLQFSLISLIPGLIGNLQDCADPQFDSYERTLTPPSSLRTSERASLLAYMGLPLQIFGKGSLFGPYTPLQQLDILADQETRSYMVGSTNALLLQQKERYSDVLVHLDEHTITISSPPLRSALALSYSDRRWIDFLTQAVNDTWDEENPSRPTTHGYAGSEEFIRLQFEEYLLALLSSVKYRQYTQKHGNDPKALLSETNGDPANDFNSDWINAWTQTANYQLFQKSTDSHLFDIVEPRHPCAGGLTVEDVQRRLAQQVAELHLDERLASSREAINKTLATSSKAVSGAINNLWADIEVMRETQRKKNEERATNAAYPLNPEKAREPLDESVPPPPAPATIKLPLKAPDLSQAQASVQAASARAGAYFSAWGSWAVEKKTKWRASATSSEEVMQQEETPTQEGQPVAVNEIHERTSAASERETGESSRDGARR